MTLRANDCNDAIEKIHDPKKTASGNRLLKKKEIEEILCDRAWDRLLKLMEGRKSPDRRLLSFLFDSDPLLQWRAVEAVSRYAKQLAETDVEDVRRIVRKALWLMNDESGGLLRRGPELIACVIMEVPELMDEYGKILSSFLVEEPFVQGAHWALSRLVKINTEVYRDEKVVDTLKKSLGDSDPAIRAYAADVLKVLDADFHVRITENELDGQSFYEYDFTSGDFLERSAKGVA